MKWIFSICLLIFEISHLSAQERFRVDYEIVAAYQNGEWDDWQEGNNTFVFNVNDNGDIIHYKANGKKETYRKVSNKDEGYTDSGEHYQIIAILDEDGLEMLLQYFDDPTIGMKLIVSTDFMIQFAKKD